MYTHVSLIKDIWSYIKPYKTRFIWATVYRVIADVVWLYPTYAFAVIVTFFSTYTQGDSLRPIYIAFTLTILAVILRHAGIYFAKSNGFRISERVSLDAELAVIRHLFNLDMEWHEKENAGNKFKRLDRGAGSLDRIIRIWINNLIEISINFAGVIIILLKFDISISIAVILFLVSFYYLSKTFFTRAVKISDMVNEKEENLSGLLFEAIANIRSVKAMSMATKIKDILLRSVEDLFASIKERIFWFQGGSAVRNFYAHTFRIAVLIFIVYGIVQGHYELGFLVLFNNYFTNVWQSMNELTEISQDFAVAKYSVARMQSIMRTAVVIDNEEGKESFPENWEKISVKNLSFSYGNKPVLQNLSFEVHRGERVGIVGLSGVGKSTLFKLFLKERETYSGDIFFDDVPLRNISKKKYYEHLAVVLQDTELFNTTLRENITITNIKEEYNKKLLDKALDVANVRDFMEKLPQGVDSVVGEKGIKLSGGEKQRVGIARSVFKNPHILLLDEATSHLDIESEEKIRDSLHQFFQNITAIVIAHRLTTIKEMDKILVIENGTIIESGNFASLYKSEGRFYELWEKQRL